MMTSRRSFLRLAGSAAACGALAGCATAEKPARIRLACQMWSVNEIWKKDPAGAFARLRALGYEGVQSYGFLKMDHAQLEKMLAAEGLRVVDMPFYLRDVTGPAFDAYLAFCKRFGIRFVFEPYWAGPTAADWRRHADALRAVAERFAAHGIRTGYHNHQHELRRHYDGYTPLEYLERAGLDMELDVGHVKLAGRDPRAWIDKLHGRLPSIHAKPGGGNSVGCAEDANDWPALLAACRAAGVEWAVVECEERRDTFDDVAASIRFLKPLV